MHFSSETDTGLSRSCSSISTTAAGTSWPRSTVCSTASRALTALGIMCKDTPDKLRRRTQGCALLLGYGDGCNFIASDVTALIKHTRDVAYMNDGEVALVSADGIRSLMNTASPSRKSTAMSTGTSALPKKGGYPHFMFKEIMEQPEAVRKTISPRIKEGQIVFDELSALMRTSSAALTGYSS